MKKISGVDGCKGEWLTFHFDGKSWSENLYEEINELYRASDSNLILIDIPIGLRTTESSERLCDLESRKILNNRKPSIFPAPSRLAIRCNEYREALQKNKEATGRGLSKQSFNIIKKIKEVDDLIQSVNYNPRNKRIREVHPEVCFWGLNGCFEMNYKKKSALGICERMQVLYNYIKDLDRIFDQTRNRYFKSQVADDDIIDALVCAVTALFNVSLSTFPFASETDTKGIPMEIVYYKADEIRIREKENAMTLKQDLKALTKEFKELGKKVTKLTKAVEKAEKTQAKAIKAKALVKAPSKKKTAATKKAPVKKRATAAKTKTTGAKKPATKKTATKKSK